MRVLWAFEIRKDIGDGGEEVEIERDGVTQSIAACPLPFRYVDICCSKGRDGVVTDA
jgi:hypothetical protein